MIKKAKHDYLLYTKASDILYGCESIEQIETCGKYLELAQKNAKTKTGKILIGELIRIRRRIAFRYEQTKIRNDKRLEAVEAALVTQGLIEKKADLH
jgi:hypothetical protein